MSFLSLLVALVLEQWRPSVDRRALLVPMGSYAGLLERNLDAGEAYQGAIAWLLAVAPTVLAAWAIHAALAAANPLFAAAFNVAVLYFTIGFRQYSRAFVEIREALNDGDLERARRRLAAWRGHPCETLGASEVARLAIETALAASHRHVFAPMFWFIVLPGPSGAILYRFALFLGRRWGGLGRAGEPGRRFDQTDPDSAGMPDAPPTRAATMAAAADPAAGPQGRFGEFARAAFRALDWLPARFTGASFAIVGDFEDAAYCWRTQAARWPDGILGVVLAAGAGALGVRLGMPIARGGVLEDRPELGLGADADVPFLDSTVGLVWRALVLWLALLLVLSVAAAFG